MTKLFLMVGAFLALTSCSTVKKLITHQAVKVDSTSGHVRDTASKTETVQDQKDLSVSDVDITVQYADSDTVSAQNIFSKPEIQALHDVVKSVSGNRVPVSVKIHIGNLSDSGKKTSSIVISASHNTDTTTLNKTVSTSTRNVSKTHAPVWMTVGAIILLVLLLLFIAYKLKQKLSL